MKELSIEEKPKSSLTYPDFSGFIRPDAVFPELKESEDERIRKRIIQSLHGDVLDMEEFNKALAWLENHVPIDEEKVLIGVRKDVALSIINFLNRDIGICPSNMECEDIENAVINSDWSKVYNYMKKKLEKQGEQPQGKSALEAAKEEKVDNANKIEPKDYSSIDPHFFKNGDNVEPKFQNGQWIVWQNQCYKVNFLNGRGYELILQNGLITSIEYGAVDKSAHLWTIQDAKDGDVLISQYDNPFIYNGKRDYFAIGAYCGILTVDRFYVAEDKCSWTQNENIHPATKEQRDYLFQKMKEAGYKWDVENKELKKID